MRALITGITGQDGSYLAELLLAKGYTVFGLVRRSASFNTGRLEGILKHPRLRLIPGDVTDGGAVHRAVAEAQPDEVYNLAAQSHVKVSFDCAAYTTETIVAGALHVLEAVQLHVPCARVYQASSSEMFGSSPPPQDERTPFRPRSPYGVAKAAAHWNAVNMRDGYGLHVSCGILFNHESPRRLETFVTRKVTRAVGRIRAGFQDTVELGNLDAVRDWGHARDYVEAMWLMLQQAEPDDYVIATGESHTVRELCVEAFNVAGLEAAHRVRTDPSYIRPTEVDALCGDATKARVRLGWSPRAGFKDLVREMVEHDIELAAWEAGRERT